MESSLARAVLLAAMVAAGAAQQPPTHAHPRFDSDRPNAKLHPLPKADGVFHFVVFGDRTGGPREGIKTLARAVADTNLLAPDLVITVGDLVQGYNDDKEWQQQADEYSRTMAALACPWFPVAGNHDLYYRGRDPARRSHDANFEAHFGPLWYAFEHKNCWFIALHSDEGDPVTGERRFDRPAAQKMSDAQLGWLQGVLRRSKGADHVFVFLHHPRWLGQHGDADYGDDWGRVHEVLRAAGNVTAVFAGHIHRIRYDGKRDGIEYFTVASVGAHLATDVPQAGYLHHINVVTVRKQRIDVATIPVGAMLDPRTISGTISDDVAKLTAEFAPRLLGRPAITPEQPCAAEPVVVLHNPASRPIEVTAVFDCGDPTFLATPDHQHVKVRPGETRRVTFALQRDGRPLDAWFAWPAITLQVDYLGDGVRVTLPRRTLPLDLDLTLDTAAPAGEQVLVLDGESACIAIDAAAVRLQDGPFTVEGWLRGRDCKGRRGFINNTESSGFGIFASEGRPSFHVFLDGKYADVVAAEPILADQAWHHVAGVFDGQELRLYVDGKLLGRTPGSGKRKGNRLPIYVGADPDRSGKPVSLFAGAIDEVRLSNVARYAGATFTPARRFTPDQDTALLLHLDRAHGPITADAAARHLHPRVVGKATFLPLARAR